MERAGASDKTHILGDAAVALPFSILMANPTNPGPPPPYNQTTLGPLRLLAFL